MRPSKAGRIKAALARRSFGSGSPLPTPCTAARHLFTTQLPFSIAKRAPHRLRHARRKLWTRTEHLAAGNEVATYGALAKVRPTAPRVVRMILLNKDVGEALNRLIVFSKCCCIAQNYKVGNQMYNKLHIFLFLLRIMWSIHSKFEFCLMTQ